MWSLGSLQQLKVLTQGALTVLLQVETTEIINQPDFYKIPVVVAHLAA